MFQQLFYIHKEFFSPVDTPETAAITVQTPYLKEEEAVIIPIMRTPKPDAEPVSEPEPAFETAEKTGSEPDTPIETEYIILPVEKVLFEYVEVKDSCGAHYEGVCVVIREGPGTNFPMIMPVRNHMILKVSGKVDYEDRSWYKIVFDEELRYPERVTGDWYIAADYVNVLYDEGTLDISHDTVPPETKQIVVDLSEQTLYAYEGEEVFMEARISTGRELSPTPVGTFTIYRKTPSRYMQGPLPGFTDSYDLPGVPWNLYFTDDGAVIHGAYWHRSFGSPYSHGCVNLHPDDARKLYSWAELGTNVIVRE